MQILYPATHKFVKKQGILYPVTHTFVKREVDPVDTDFSFVIDGNSYIVDYLAGENLDFTIDWGDGSQTVVDSNDISQRSHNYLLTQEWTITIKNYVSGWIQFYHSSTTAQRTKLRRILTPFPKSNTRNSFGSCFYGCNSLTTIPEALFNNTPNVTNFGSCFYGCISLTTIPEALFNNTPNVTSFYSCFRQCYDLTALPADLFSNTPNVTTFSYCFESCRKMSFINLIFSEQVLSRDVNYSSMFYVSSTANSHKDYAPELWKSATTTSAYKTMCFRNNTALLNYDDIPAGWR